MTALDQHPTRDETKEKKKKKKKRRWMPWCTSCACFEPSQKTSSSSSYSFLLRITKVKETLPEKNDPGGGKLEKGLRHGFFGKSTDYVRLSEHAMIFLRGLFLKARKKSQEFPKHSKLQQSQQHNAAPNLPPRPRSPTKPDLHRSNSDTVSTPATLTVISPELHQIEATTTSSVTPNKEEITTKVNKSDTMVGLSVLTIILLVLGSSGRGLAIVLTSAFFCLISFVKTIPSVTGRVEGKEGDVVVDCDSEEYKKKVVLEGLLERKNRR